MAETLEDEIKGQLVQIDVVEVDSSEAEPVETSNVLSLVTEDSMSFSIDEDTEEQTLANIRRTRRYRTHNTVDFSFDQLIAIDLSALEQLNLVDEDGKLNFDETRRLNEDLVEDVEVVIDINYLKNEAGDIEHTHRLHDVEVYNLDIEMGSTPPVTSIEMMVHGDIELDHTTA